MHRHAFGFLFSPTFSLSAASVNFLVVFVHCFESASTNHAAISCYFAYFNSSFFLSDSALCLIRLCPVHWAQLDRKIIFLNVLVNFFSSTNHAAISCYFAYFNSSFSLSDSALCLIRLCPVHWAQLDRKIIFLNVLVNFFCEFRSVKIAYDRFSCIDYTKKFWSGYKL